MRNFLIFLSALAFQFSIAQEETAKDSVKTTELNEVVVQSKKKSIEQKACHLAGETQKVPAQRMVDFVNNRTSQNLPKNSYLPGLTPSNLTDILPPFIAQSLKMALPQFGKKIPSVFGNGGYYTNEAILVGVESRTSSPVRIPRHPETLQHPQVKGLFPCAEGAGYAGGIISAAIDGQASATAVSIQIYKQ